MIGCPVCRLGNGSGTPQVIVSEAMSTLIDSEDSDADGSSHASKVSGPEGAPWLDSPHGSLFGKSDDSDDSDGSFAGFNVRADGKYSMNIEN